MERLTSGSVKERIIAVEHLFLRRKSLTLRELSEALAHEYGIYAERKTLYDDIAALTRFLPIDTRGSGATFRYVLMACDRIGG